MCCVYVCVCVCVMCMCVCVVCKLVTQTGVLDGEMTLFASGVAPPSIMLAPGGGGHQRGFTSAQRWIGHKCEGRGEGNSSLCVP